MGTMIMQRTAQDVYHAQLIAQGMEDAGAEVFSIVNDGCGFLQVFCKHGKTVGADAIDSTISSVVRSRAAYYQAV